ncbi:hypothetical protein Skr01_51720 [Sphaerisporangium krabiense]|nr:hypothetical protein Skr01_51720 [Sphaerisporangium krabiense]
MGRAGREEPGLALDLVHGDPSGEHQLAQQRRGETEAGQPGVQSHSTGYVVMHPKEQIIGQPETGKSDFSHDGGSYRCFVKAVITRIIFVVQPGPYAAADF